MLQTAEHIHMKKLHITHEMDNTNLQPTILVTANRIHENFNIQQIRDC